MGVVTVTSKDSRLLQEIADGIARSKKAVVVTGAGISTNCGIPDFRSEEGLYNLVKSRYPDVVVKGKELFDAVLFNNATSTKVFYTFIAELRESILAVKETSLTHKFVRTLCETGRLLRCYTQNIDGLEAREGMTTNLALGKGKRKRRNPDDPDVSDTEEEKGCQVVQLHGDLNMLRCTHCQALCKYDKVKVGILRDGEAPDCPDCIGKDKTRRESGKRGTRIGTLRPNIVLYGEEHPLGEKIGTLTAADLRSNPDYMIVLGTSLKVHGLKSIVKAMAQAVHARQGKVIYVNDTPAANSIWKNVIDFHVEMDCDKFVSCLKDLRPDIWVKQGKIDKLMKETLLKKAQEDKENISRLKAKAKAVRSRKPLIPKVENRAAQGGRKRKAVDLSFEKTQGDGALAKRPKVVDSSNRRTGLKVSRGQHAESKVKESPKESEGNSPPAKRSIVSCGVQTGDGGPPEKRPKSRHFQYIESKIKGSLKENEDSGPPAKRLKVSRPAEKAKADNSEETKADGSGKTKTGDSSVKGTGVPETNPAKKFRSTGPTTRNSKVEESTPTKNPQSEISAASRAKADGPEETKADSFTKTKTRDLGVKGIGVPEIHPAKKLRSADPTTRNSKVEESAPTKNLQSEVPAASRAKANSPLKPGTKIWHQPTPPATSGCRIKKMGASTTKLAAPYDHQSVPSTPTRSRNSKLVNPARSIQLVTPEPSCSPPPTTKFAVEIVPPEQKKSFVDRVAEVKGAEREENPSTESADLRRSQRVGRNTVV